MWVEQDNGGGAHSRSIARSASFAASAATHSFNQNLTAAAVAAASAAEKKVAGQARTAAT